MTKMEENVKSENEGKKILEAVFIAAVTAVCAIFGVLFLLAGKALLTKEERFEALGIIFFSQSPPPDQVLLFAITEFMLAGIAIFTIIMIALAIAKNKIHLRG
jgi:Na+/proline symporter